MIYNSFWEILSGISEIKIRACSKSHESTVFSIGKGKVKVNFITPMIIRFIESGFWDYFYGNNTEVHFNNIYLWEFNENESLITLEHLRYGKNNPFFLFNMIETENKMLRSSSPRICGNDSYTAEIKVDENSFTLKCLTKGPNKNEEILYFYS
jgi:Family of unknown function (DUF6314)